MYNVANYCSECNIELTDNGEALECDECYVKQFIIGRHYVSLLFGTITSHYTAPNVSPKVLDITTHEEVL